MIRFPASLDFKLSKNYRDSHGLYNLSTARQPSRNFGAPERPVTYPSRLRIIWYDVDSLEEKADATVADCQNFKIAPGLNGCIWKGCRI